MLPTAKSTKLKTPSRFLPAAATKALGMHGFRVNIQVNTMSSGGNIGLNTSRPKEQPWQVRRRYGTLTMKTGNQSTKMSAKATKKSGMFKTWINQPLAPFFSKASGQQRQQHLPSA